jgi:DnaJ-class molecular chaperone
MPPPSEKKGVQIDARNIPKDFYRRLGLADFSTLDEVKAAFRKLALQWHPDRHPEERKKQAAEKFKFYAQAYEVLTKHKLDYDQYLRPVSASLFGNPASMNWSNNPMTMRHMEEVYRWAMDQVEMGPYADIFRRQQKEQQ